jgi:hypothetical protein
MSRITETTMQEPGEGHTPASPIETRDGSAPTVPVPYEAPAVERVMTSDDLAREIHYAGVDSGQGPG